MLTHSVPQHALLSEIDIDLTSPASCNFPRSQVVYCIVRHFWKVLHTSPTTPNCTCIHLMIGLGIVNNLTIRFNFEIDSVISCNK